LISEFPEVLSTRFKSDAAKTAKSLQWMNEQRASQLMIQQTNESFLGLPAMINLQGEKH
jgi:hypothetical protein